MKTRQSHVSNSSCASFILVWRHKIDNEISFDEAFTSLTECVEKYNDDSTGEHIALYKFLKEHTISKANLFTTNIFISMLNDLLDFGSEIAILCFLLLNNDQFEIVYKSIEGE